VKQASGDLEDGNWDETPLKQGAKIRQVQIVMTNPHKNDEIPMEEIETRDKDGDAWVIVHR
jgi:hypothetical protein